MDSLLIAHHDKALRQMMKDHLEKSDFVLIDAVTAERVLNIIACHTIDLIILDLFLTNITGPDFIQDIRNLTQSPIIIIADRDLKEQKLESFYYGADDYIVHPIDYDDLIARVKANIRRYKTPVQDNQQKASVSNTSAQIVEFEHWILDRNQYQLFDTDHNCANLTMHEFQLLNVLVEEAGHVLRRDELCRCIREDNYIPTPRAIDVKITRIRKKINDDAHNPQIIKTIRGAGYMFNIDKIRG